MNLFRRPVHPSNWISAWIDRAAKRKLLGKNGNVRVKVDENRWSGGVNRETTGLKRAFKSSTQLVSPVKPFYILLFYAE